MLVRTVASHCCLLRAVGGGLHVINYPNRLRQIDLNRNHTAAHITQQQQQLLLPLLLLLLIFSSFVTIMWFSLLLLLLPPGDVCKSSACMLFQTTSILHCFYSG